MEAYTRRITSYLNSLPDTRIHFLFFSQNQTRELIPRLKTTAKRLVFNRRPYYLVQGAGNQGYFYTYEETTVKYLVHSNNTSVTAFERLEPHTQLHSGGTLVANLGDHLTVGLIARHPHLLLDTHLTLYYENDGVICRDDETQCKVILDNATTVDTHCINAVTKRVYATKTMKTVYTTDHIPIISHYIAIFQGRRNGGSKTSYGGQRESEPPNYNGISFNESVAEFLRHHTIAPVLQYDPNLTDVTLIYDEYSTTGPGGSRHIVLLFDFDSEPVQTRKIYYFETDKVLMAYYASTLPIRSRTPAEQAAYRQITAAPPPPPIYVTH